jgi:pilus assembly protein Flp/PilA
MLTRLKQFLVDESGATAIEYALIAALVAMALVGSVTALGASLKSIFATVATALNTVSG